MEAIGTMAGGIAHDFNNIPAPILGYSELALTSIAPGNPLTSDLHQITRARLRALVEKRPPIIKAPAITQQKNPEPNTRHIYNAIAEQEGLEGTWLNQDFRVSSSLEKKLQQASGFQG